MDGTVSPAIQNLLKDENTSLSLYETQNGIGSPLKVIIIVIVNSNSNTLTPLKKSYIKYLEVKATQM